MRLAASRSGGIGGVGVWGVVSGGGIDIVGGVFSAVINVVHDAGPMTDLGQPDDDSELRFYSVFFVAYGVIMVPTARDLEQHGRRVPILLALFFAGGLARLLSYFTVGPPHALFMLLMVIELLLPPLLYLAWRSATANPQDG